MSERKQLPIERACEVVGGQSALARTLGVPPAAVNQWVKGRRPVPDKYALPIERATRGAVSRKDICPDAWQSYWPELKEATHA